MKMFWLRLIEKWKNISEISVKSILLGFGIICLGIISLFLIIKKTQAATEITKCQDTSTTIDRCFRGSLIGDENQDITVKRGGVYVVQRVRPNEEKLKLNSLTVAEGGKVTHLPAGTDGNALIDGGDYSVSWSGYFKGQQTVGSREINIKAICVNPSSSLIDTTNNQPMTAVIVPVVFKTGNYPGGPIAYSVDCYPNLDPTKIYKITTASQTKNFFSAFDADPDGRILSALAVGVNSNQLSCSGNKDPEYINGTTFYSKCKDKKKYKFQLGYNPKDFVYTKQELGYENKGLVGTYYPGNDPNSMFKYAQTDTFSNRVNYYYVQPYPTSTVTPQSVLYGYTYKGKHSETYNKFLFPAKINLDVAGEVKLDGIIDVNGKGYPGTYGLEFKPGWGDAGGKTGQSFPCDSSAWWAGGGGGHGGSGRDLWSDVMNVKGWDYRASPPYDDEINLINPTLPGSGGAGTVRGDQGFLHCDYKYGTGGNGGGVVIINAKAVNIGSDGAIVANGENGRGDIVGHTGGGAGGTINVVATESFSNAVTGTTLFDANGGDDFRVDPIRRGERGTLYYKDSKDTITPVHRCTSDPGQDGPPNYCYYNLGSNIQAMGGKSGGGGGRIAIVSGGGSPPPSNTPEYTVDKSTTQGMVKQNGTITYNITVAQTSVASTEVTVNDNYFGLTYLSGAPGNYRPIDSDSLEWTIPASDFNVSNSFKQSYDLVFKVNGDCATDVTNTVSITWSVNGSNTNMTDAVSNQVFCPINVLGDVGAMGNISTSNIVVNGPAVLVANQISGTEKAKPGSSGKPTEKISPYSFNLNSVIGRISDSINRLVNKRAVSRLNDLADELDLNPNNNPGGGASQFTGDVNFSNPFSGQGTIIIKGDGAKVNINSGFTGSSDGTMGIIVNGEGAEVKIDLSGQVLSANNVGLYVPKGMVKIIGNNKIDWTGFIVAKNINFGTTGAGGTITWSGAFAKNPPPGFADLLKIVKQSEIPPETPIIP